MAPPYALSPPQWSNGELFSKLPNLWPPPIISPPLPPPLPPFMYHNLRNAGFAWPILPRIPRAQRSCRPKKIINICDPQTGQDVTEEILSSVGNNCIVKKNTLKKVAPPIRPHNLRRSFTSSPMPIPVGFARKAPTPTQVIMKCNQEPDYFWPDEGRQWNGVNAVSQSFLGSCSWPPSAPLEENSSIDFDIPSRKRYQSLSGNKKNIVKYSRDVLLSLRYHPLAMSKPDSLPDLDVFKKEIQGPEKVDKVCHYGTQTTMAKPVRSFIDKSRGVGASTPKSKPKPRTYARPKFSTTKQNADNGKEVIENDMALRNMDRGDSREIEKIMEKIDSLFM